MEILRFTPTPGRPPADVKGAPDPSFHSEIPSEVHAFFSLTPMLDRSIRTMNRHLEQMIRCPSSSSLQVQGRGDDGATQSFIAEFVEQLEAKRRRSQMWAVQARQCCAVMSHCRATLPVEQREQLETEQARIVRDLLGRSLPTEIADEYQSVLTAPNDFFDKLLELIALIKNGYLAGYEHIIAAYGDFFTDFNKEITAKLQEWIWGANDGKEVKLDAPKLRAALDSLMQKYSHPNPASVLFPKPGQGGASKEEAEKWQKALGLPDSCLKKNADGTWCVVMDIGPLQAMRASIPATGGVVTWDTARYSAWRTGFDAQEEHMKNMLQSFTQKYSNANAYHDNFNKTLSSHLSQFADMLKAMLNF